MTTYTVHHGDCLAILPTLPAQSVDAVIADPPYPMIKRDYGMLTEAEWWDLMMGVVKEVRRVLKPAGSAVFILQPNSKKVGSMRGWLWEFMAWVCREWNMVQDVWWWNINALPEAHAIQGKLTRPSAKANVWCGEPNCHRNQDAVLWSEEDSTLAWRKSVKALVDYKNPSGQHRDTSAMVRSLESKNGVTPFNVIPLSNGGSQSTSGAYGHGAGTPLKLADWWTRYIVPSGGVVLDPFAGAGTMGVAAINNGASFIGIEKMEKYADIAQHRIGEAVAEQAFGLFAEAAD